MIFTPSLQNAQPLACRLLSAALDRGRLSHAYLLSGRAAAAKASLAVELACFLNCQQPDKSVQGSCLKSSAQRCRNCQWIAAGEHPQAFMVLASTLKSQKIPVEAARAITEELSRTSIFTRIIFIPEAGQGSFHRASASALLKSIEEPPERCVFLLAAPSADMVLPTVASRCQEIPVNERLSFGYLSDPRLPEETQGVLAAAVNEFCLESRQQGSAGGLTALSPWRRADLAQALSEKLLALAAEAAPGALPGAASPLYVLAAGELRAWGPSGATSAGTSAYLGELLAAVEEHQGQLNQFVKPAHVYESFGFALIDLKLKHQGELCRAKH